MDGGGAQPVYVSQYIAPWQVRVPCAPPRAPAPTRAMAERAHAVLLVCSSHPSGSSTTQLQTLFSSFRSLRVRTQITSLAGGAVPLDADPPAALVADPPTQHQLLESKPLWSLSAQDYDAFVLVGGPGALHDFPDNFGARKLLERAVELGAPVAAVGSGTAALPQLFNSDGFPVVQGLRVTCPTVGDDDAGSLEAAFARSKSSVTCMSGGESHVVTDANVTTAQNTASAVELVRVVYALLPTPLEKAERIARRVEQAERSMDELTKELRGMFAKMRQDESTFARRFLYHAACDVASSWPYLLLLLLAAVMWTTQGDVLVRLNTLAFRNSNHLKN